VPVKNIQRKKVRKKLWGIRNGRQSVKVSRGHVLWNKKMLNPSESAGSVFIARVTRKVRRDGLAGLGLGLGLGLRS
tara:strand:+ start:264 stop:491 length:228 start_codon:yes stop_codon:yes gene_type:complete